MKKMKMLSMLFLIATAQTQCMEDGAFFINCLQALQASNALQQIIGEVQVSDSDRLLNQMNSYINDYKTLSDEIIYSIDTIKLNQNKLNDKTVNTSDSTAKSFENLIETNKKSIENNETKRNECKTKFADAVNQYINNFGVIYSWYGKFYLSANNNMSAPLVNKDQFIKTLQNAVFAFEAKLVRGSGDTQEKYKDETDLDNYESSVVVNGLKLTPYSAENPDLSKQTDIAAGSNTSLKMIAEYARRV